MEDRVLRQQRRKELLVQQVSDGGGGGGGKPTAHARSRLRRVYTPDDDADVADHLLRDVLAHHGRDWVAAVHQSDSAGPHFDDPQLPDHNDPGPARLTDGDRQPALDDYAKCCAAHAHNDAGLL